MPETIFYGRQATLIAQFEDDFRTQPANEDIAAQTLKFSEFTIGQEAELQEDPTIDPAVLAEKRDEQDSTVTGSGKHIFCLNDFGFWAKMLLGDPVTTGPGPYTHTWTLTNDLRPSALMEFADGPADNREFHRYFGMKLNELAWAVMEADQSFTTGLIGAVELKPFPVAAYHDAPAAKYAKSRACKKRGNVYDVLNNSTLGEITKANVSINNDLDAEAFADGREGFGVIMTGDVRITGSISVLLKPGTAVQAALTHTSKKLVLASANAAGTHSATLTLPNIEFDRPKQERKTSKGIRVDLNWRAHKQAGADPVTLVVVNAVPSY